MSLLLLTLNATTGCIAAFIILTVSAILYLIYKYGIREKSFEEALAEQRKRNEQEEMQLKNEKTKKEKENKKHKKWGKKKEKMEQYSVSETTTIAAASEPAGETEPKEGLVQRKKNKVSNQMSPVPSQPLSVKPISETPVVTSVQPPQETEKKGKSEATVTKDKEKSKENTKSDLPKIQNTVEEEKPEPKVSVQPVLVVPSIVASKKKKKVEQSDKADVRVTASKLLSLIKETALNDGDSQMLIDTLLNMQKEASEWKQATVKKTSPDKEQVLDSERQNHQTAGVKTKQDLSQAANKAWVAEKNSFQEKIAVQSHEIKTLNFRLKQTQDQLSMEKFTGIEKMKQVEKSFAEKQAANMKKLAEEKDKLEKSFKRLESESRAATVSTELEKVKKSRDDLQKVHNLLVEQHTQHISGHKRELLNLNAQLVESKKLQQEVQEKYATSADEIATLKKKCETLETAKKQVDQESKSNDDSKAEIAHLKARLDESKLLSADLDSQVKKFSDQVIELTKQNNKLSSELKTLQTENERLSSELAESNERVAGDGQEMLQQNGEVNGKGKDEVKDFVDQEKIIKEKEALMSDLYDDLNSCKTKILSLNDELEQQKQKNNELREKNWKIMDNLTAAEKKTEDAVKEAEKLQKSHGELNEKLKTENTQYQMSQKELTDRLCHTEESLGKLKELSSSQLQEFKLQQQKTSQFSSEVAQLKTLKEGLESTLSNSEIKAEVLQVQLSKTEGDCRSCLQRIFPAVTVDHSLPLNDWLSQFEKEAVTALQSMSHSESEVEKLLARFNAEKEELQLKLTQYETVLAETEATLNRLQDGVKDQESVWKEQLQCKEKDLSNLQDQLKTVQGDMDVSNMENACLNQKLEEVNQNYINIKQQIETKDKTIEDLQKQVASFDHLKNEIEDLKSKLEKEKKISKDFSTQMVRLDSLVKIGQDALKAEQETVKKLQSQIQATKVGSPANGTSSPTITEDKTSGEKQLKPEKPKKSKKLDASAKK